MCYLLCFCFLLVGWLWRMRFNDVKVRLDHQKLTIRKLWGDPPPFSGGSWGRKIIKSQMKHVESGFNVLQPKRACLTGKNHAVLNETCLSYAFGRRKKILEVFLGSVQVPVKEPKWSILSSFPFFSISAGFRSEFNTITRNMLSPFVCKFWLLIWPNLYGYPASMKPTVCLWKYAFWKLIVFIPHLFSRANLLFVYKSLGISEDFIPHREFKFTIENPDAETHGVSPFTSSILKMLRDTFLNPILKG